MTEIWQVAWVEVACHVTGTWQAAWRHVTTTVDLPIRSRMALATSESLSVSILMHFVVVNDGMEG